MRLRIQLMNMYKNNATDLILRYNASTYRKLEKMMGISNGSSSMVPFHLMLALLGLEEGKRIPVTEKNGDRVDDRSFSLRTVYQKEATNFEVYFGLLTILDNLDEDYEKVVSQWAFEKTEVNNTPFLKMKNVQTFYEYMIGGLEVIKETFLRYGDNPVDVASQINSYLKDDVEELFDMADLLLDGLEENDT